MITPVDLQCPVCKTVGYAEVHTTNTEEFFVCRCGHEGSLL